MGLVLVLLYEYVETEARSIREIIATQKCTHRMSYNSSYTGRKLYLGQKLPKP